LITVLSLDAVYTSVYEFFSLVITLLLQYNFPPNTLKVFSSSVVRTGIYSVKPKKATRIAQFFIFLLSEIL